MTNKNLTVKSIFQNYPFKPRCHSAIKLLCFSVFTALLVGCSTSPTLSKSSDGRTLSSDFSPCSNKANCVSSLDTRSKYYIEPLTLPSTSESHSDQISEALSADEVMTHLKSILLSMSMEIQFSDSHYLHAVATSRIFRFKDDLEVVITSDASTIHVKSASRVGYSDFGVNRARVEEIRTALKQVLKPSQG